MKKIDFTKVEETLKKAIHEMYMNKILEGKEVISKRASSFYGLETGSLPKPEDPVVSSFKEPLEDTGEEISEESQDIAIYESRFQPASTPVSFSEIQEETHVATPLYLVRKHLAWCKKRKVPDPYKLIGTTKEELDLLKKKTEMTEEDVKRIQELLDKSIILKREVLKILEIETDEHLIEMQKKN